MADNQLEGGLKDVKASINVSSKPGNINGEVDKVVEKDERVGMNTPAETQSHGGSTPKGSVASPKKVDDSKIIDTGSDASGSISINSETQSSQKDEMGADPVPEEVRENDSVDGDMGSAAGGSSGAADATAGSSSGAMGETTANTPQDASASSGGDGINPQSEENEVSDAERSTSTAENTTDGKDTKKDNKVVLNEKAKSLLSQLTFSKKVDSEVEKIEKEASGGGMDSAESQSVEAAPKVVEKTAEEKELEKETSEAAEGKKKGEQVGKTRGYGKLMKVEGEETTFVSFPTTVDGTEFKDPKAYYEKEKENLAKMSSAYQDGFYEGYNKGYAMGQRLKAEEKKAAAAEEEAKKMQDPNFKLGRVVGTQMGIAKAKKENMVKMTLPNGMEIEKKYAEIHENVMANKGPLGNDRDGTEKEKEKKDTVFQNAFFEYYNKFYSKTLAAVNKKPDQSELMSDPSYKKGYVPGNQLARGEGDEKTLKTLKENYSSKKAQETAKKDEEYNKEMTGFFTGYNAGYREKANEKAAAKKKADDEMKKDPVFKFARTAGVIIGTLKTAFKGEDPYKNAVRDDKLKAIGFDMQLPSEVDQILKNKGAQGDLINAMIGTDTKKVGYFDRGYQMGFNEGYAKGPSKKREVADSSVKKHPDYVRFTKITKEVPMIGVDEPVLMNLGQLAAYSKYVHSITPKDDKAKLKSLEKTYEEAKSAVKDAKSPMFEDAYLTYYNQTYVDLRMGSGDLGKKLKKGQQEKEDQKNAADKLFGQKLADKYEEQRLQLVKIGKGRGKHLDKLKDNVKTLREAYFKTIESEVDADETLSKEEKEQIKDLRKTGFYRGFSEKTLANNQNQDLKDENDNTQVNQRADKSAKVFDNEELSEKAKELSISAAGEGFTAAYEKQKSKAKKGVQPEKISLTLESEACVKQKKSLSKFKTKDGKTLERGDVDKLLEIYVVSYNGADNKYGAGLGNQLIIAYFNGYQSLAAPEKMITGDGMGESIPDYIGKELVAFEKGVADAENEKQYTDFKEAAIKSGVSNLEEEEMEVSYTSEEAKEDVTKEWSLIIYKHFNIPYSGESAPLYDAKSKKVEVKNDKGYSRLFKERNTFIENHLTHYANKMEKTLKDSGKYDDAGGEDALRSDISMYQKDYRTLVAALVKEIEKKQNDSLAYFMGLGQSLVSQLGMGQAYPEDIKNVLDKIKTNELTPKTEHPKYIEGDNDGIEWAIQIKNDLMSMNDLAAAMDEKMGTNASAGVKKAEQTGKKFGKEHAESLDHQTQLPKTLSTILNEKEKEKEEEQELYLNNYWKTKDHEGGSLAGHQAAMEGLTLSDMALFYVEMKSDEGEVINKQNTTKNKAVTIDVRGVRNKDIFEGAFITARNAVSGQDQEKLKEEYDAKNAENAAMEGMSDDEKQAFLEVKEYKENVDEFAKAHAKLVAYSVSLNELYPASEAQTAIKKNKKVTELYTNLGGDITKFDAYLTFDHTNFANYKNTLLEGIGEPVGEGMGESSESQFLNLTQKDEVLAFFESKFGIYLNEGMADAKSNLPLLIQGQHIDNKSELSKKEAKRVEAAMEEMVEAVTDDDDFHHHTLSGMPYITDLISVEQNIDESRQLVDEKYDLLIELDLMLYDNTDHALEDRIIELQTKKDEGTIDDEEIIILENLIKSIEESNEANNNRDQIIEMIKHEEEARLEVGLNLMKFLNEKIKFAKGSDEREITLDYLDGFIDKLVLPGTHAFTGPFIKTSGGSELLIESNSEDFKMKDMSIKIQKGRFDFTSTGFEYVDKQNAIKLLDGSAVVPNLDAGSNGDAEDKEYSFKNLSIDLKKGLYEQLKSKKDSLTTKTNAKSSGKRGKAKIKSKHQDKESPSNVKLKSHK